MDGVKRARAISWVVRGWVGGWVGGPECRMVVRWEGGSCALKTTHAGYSRSGWFEKERNAGRPGERARYVNVNTTDATAGATALLLPAQNTHTLHDPIRDTEHARCVCFTAAAGRQAAKSWRTVPMASIVLRSAALVGWLIKATAATEDATG